MINLAYSGTELTSLKGFKVLRTFAEDNNLIHKSLEEVTQHLIDTEETIAAECMSDYYDTLKDVF